jgi:fission 1 protein
MNGTFHSASVASVSLFHLGLTYLLLLFFPPLQYAFALSKSSEPSELRYAVSMLDGLVAEGFEHQTDCMYGAATALYLLGDYEEARSRAEAILRTNPQARFAKELHLAAIEGEEEQKREQLKKAAVGSVAAAAVVGLIGVATVMLQKKH